MNRCLSTATRDRPGSPMSLGLHATVARPAHRERAAASGRRAARVAAVTLLALVLGGCGWFSWVPWIGDRDKGPDPMKPAELVDFAPEVRIDRLWRVSIGKGLGRKYLRAQPEGAGQPHLRRGRLWRGGSPGPVLRQAGVAFADQPVQRGERRAAVGPDGLQLLRPDGPQLRRRRRGRRRRHGAHGHHRRYGGRAVGNGRRGSLACLPRQRSPVPARLRRRCGVRADHRRPPAGAGGGRRERALELRYPGSRADAARHGLAGFRERHRLCGVCQRYGERHTHRERGTDLGSTG